MRSNKILQLAAVVFLLANAPAVWCQDSGQQPNADRFEGYIFLDVDGQPLPFQTDEEIEEFLSTAEIETMARIPVGVTSPKKAILAGQGVRAHAVFKYADVTKKNHHEKIGGKNRLYILWRDWYGYDIAAYKLDRLMGLNRTAPVVLRRYKRRDGAYGIWLEGTVTEHYRRENGYEPEDLARWNQQQQLLRVFNNLVANRDPNQGNSLIGNNWRLWHIDCSRCFGTNADLLTPQGITNCERGIWQAIQKLNADSLKETLGEYLNSSEIKALLKRRDKLVDHIQGLVDEWGEEIVFYDLRPPSGTVPWVTD